MKIKILCCAIFATAFAGNFAPRVLAAPAKTTPFNAQLLRQVRSRYAKISRNLSRYRVVKSELHESAEGGELTASFDGKMLRRIIANNYGETARWRDEYSFENGRLSFAHRTEKRYAFPSDETQSMLEAGIVRRRTDERFYFANGKMFRRVVEVREKEKSLRASITSGAGFSQRKGRELEFDLSIPAVQRLKTAQV